MKPIPAIHLGKDEHGKDVTIDVEILMKTRLLVQANSGGGKSFLIRRLCEQVFGHVPTIILDPEGEFATLREKFGYVLVGKGGETPADPRSAKLVAHKLLELRASAVIDLYEMNPSERHLYVKLFSEAMIDAPKHLWRPTIIIIDEVHTFAPEKGSGESIASDAVTAFPTRGRKRQFCAVFATQRLGKLRKDASAELLNRLVGPTFEDVDLKRAADLLSIPGDEKREFDAKMRVLDPGNFYAIGRAICRERTLFKVGGVQTSHEISQAKFGSEPPPAPDQVKKLLPQLADLPKQAEESAKTEAELRAEVRQLKTQVRQLETAQRQVKPVKQETKEIPILTKQHEALLTKHIQKLNDIGTQVRDLRNELLTKLAKGQPVIRKAVMNFSEEIKKISQPPPPKQWHQGLNYGENQTVKVPRVDESNGTLPTGEEKILSACIQFDPGITRQSLTVLTGFKRSTRDAYIARLKDKGLVDSNGETVFATDTGKSALPNAQPLPTGEELQKYWLQKLPEGERKIFELLLSAYPAPVGREFISEQTGFKRSTRDAYLSRMSSKMLVMEPARGMVQAANQLFE
jgi:hypothetical protein